MKIHSNPTNVISRNLKLGGMYKCLGGVNMREAHIYMEKEKKKPRKKYTELGGVVSQLGGLCP